MTFKRLDNIYPTMNWVFYKISTTTMSIWTYLLNIIVKNTSIYKFMIKFQPMLLYKGGEINKSILSDAGNNVYDKRIFFSEIGIIAVFL